MLLVLTLGDVFVTGLLENVPGILQQSHQLTFVQTSGDNLAYVERQDVPEVHINLAINAVLVNGPHYLGLCESFPTVLCEV